MRERRALEATGEGWGNGVVCVATRRGNGGSITCKVGPGPWGIHMHELTSVLGMDDSCSDEH